MNILGVRYCTGIDFVKFAVQGPNSRALGVGLVTAVIGKMKETHGKIGLTLFIFFMEMTRIKKRTVTFTVRQL